MAESTISKINKKIQKNGRINSQKIKIKIKMKAD